MSATENTTDYIAKNSNIYQQLKINYETLISNIIQLFFNIYDACLKVKHIDLENNKKFLQQIEEQTLFNNPKLLLKMLEDIVAKILNINDKIASQLSQQLKDDTERTDYQKDLEKKLIYQTRKEEKLLLQIEVSNTKIISLKESLQNLEQEKNNIRQEINKQKEIFEQQIWCQNQEIQRIKHLNEQIHSSKRKFEMKSNQLSQQLVVAQQQSNRGSLTVAPLGVIGQIQQQQQQLQQQSPQQQQQQQQQQNQLQIPIPQQKQISPNYSPWVSQTLLGIDKQSVYNQQNTNGKTVPGQISQNMFQMIKNSIDLKPMQALKIEKKRSESARLRYQRSNEQIKQDYSHSLNRLNMKIQQRDKKNSRMQTQVEALQGEVNTLKEQQDKLFKKAMFNEANTEQNPVNLLYYKNILEEKKQEINVLKKNCRRFNILEKQLLVKAKAFEDERSETHLNVCYLSDRVNKLSAILKDKMNQQKQSKAYSPDQKLQVDKSYDLKSSVNLIML